MVKILKMKKAFLLSAIVIGMATACCGQNFKPDSLPNSMITYGYGSSLAVHKMQDGRIYVEGDSLSVIKMLVNFLGEWQDRHFEKFVIVSAAMNFIETIPAAYKKGKKWEAYKKEIDELLKK